MKKIKVLHIISDTNIGGAGKLLLNLSACIDKKRFDFIFAVPAQSRLFEKLNKEGSVYCYSGQGDLSLDLRSIISLCRIIRKTRPHIIHTHSSLSGRIAAILCGVKKSRIVYTKHCVFDLPTIYRYNIKFIFVGDGSRREELTSFCKQLDVCDRITFTGFVDNVAEYMNIFDLNINCSTGTETSCLAISEGLSIGLPAIVSDFGGNPNMVINGMTGYVFPQNNHHELYKIIKNLKYDPETRKKLEINAQLDFQNRFSADIMTKQYETFYISLIKNR